MIYHHVNRYEYFCSKNKSQKLWSSVFLLYNIGLVEVSQSKSLGNFIHSVIKLELTILQKQSLLEVAIFEIIK